MSILYCDFKFVFIEFNTEISVTFSVVVLNISIYCKLEISSKGRYFLPQRNVNTGFHLITSHK